MFGNFAQIASLLKNAGQIKDKMKEAGERLGAARIVGQAAGGQVQATVDGRGEPVAVRIDPKLVESGDVELIEDLTVAAFRDAVQRSREAAVKELESATGGMSLGPMMDLLR